MSVDPQKLSRKAGLTMVGGRVNINFADGRQQTVYVDESSSEAFRLWSVVARRAVVDSLQTPMLDAWHRNRLVELVGFSIDERGRMIGEAWVPKAGVTAMEWALYVKTLAAACDRFEYLITGKDVEQ